MRTNYILDGRDVRGVSESQYEKWIATRPDRRVAGTQVGPYYVSTVFLGGCYEDFETLIFLGDRPTGAQHPTIISCRCATWEQAEAQHADTVARVCARDPLADPQPGDWLVDSDGSVLNVTGREGHSLSYRAGNDKFPTVLPVADFVAARRDWDARAMTTAEVAEVLRTLSPQPEAP